MRKLILCLLLPLVLMGCGAKSEWASDEIVTRMAYREPGPATLTLVTMINNRSGGGAHTALVINASQRVIWDPAGSFEHPRIPERNDVIYGVNPEVYNVYKSAHARETFHVVLQEVAVSPEVAEKAFALARQMGPVGQAQCSASTASLLSQLPGFETIGSHFFPKKLMDAFARYPGVTTDKLFENDAGDKATAFSNAEAYQPQTF
ncbi:hypothetical protein [Planktotalea arctica]|uniref:hypothetical protein n=1 Tax=Planktotalea arctica TaxID=1481893 RepID=UPI000A17806A|nr:hypothetical protein [Planktotalea arctica]